MEEAIKEFERRTERAKNHLITLLKEEKVLKSVVEMVFCYEVEADQFLDKNEIDLSGQKRERSNQLIRAIEDAGYILEQNNDVIGILYLGRKTSLAFHLAEWRWIAQ